MSYIDPQSLARISMTVAGNALTIGVKQPFRCWVPDASNPGSNIEKVITAPAAIYGDGHASENFTMGSMGQTLARDWLENFPISWYWTFFSGTVYWVASRNNCMKVMPADTQIGYLGTAPSGTRAQGDAFVAATITPADFAGLPVWGPIGWMPIQRAANKTDVKLVSLIAGQDGFGNSPQSVRMVMPTGQNGAESGKHTKSDGTDPSFSYQVFSYWQRDDGSLKMRAVLNNTTGGTAGNGANTLLLACPLGASISENYTMFGLYQNGSTRNFSVYAASSGDPLIEIYSYTTGANLVCNDLNHANDRRIYLTGEFQAF